MSTTTREPDYRFAANPEEQARCATLDGLRAVTRFLQAHPEAMGSRLFVMSGSNPFAWHTNDADEFLAVEQLINGTRNDGPSSVYVSSVREFGGGIALVVQTYRSILDAAGDQ